MVYNAILLTFNLFSAHNAEKIKTKVNVFILAEICCVFVTPLVTFRANLSLYLCNFFITLGCVQNPSMWHSLKFN